MASRTRAVTDRNLGAWLLKTDPSGTPVADLVTSVVRDVPARCVRQSYRTALMEPGQIVLLWVSGHDPRTPAGIHAQGHLMGAPAQTRDQGAADARLQVPVRLRLVDPPVLRSDLVADPVLSRIEVLRMPAGSNPSYLTLEELARLRAGWPQVEGG